MSSARTAATRGEALAPQCGVAGFDSGVETFNVPTTIEAANCRSTQSPHNPVSLRWPVLPLVRVRRTSRPLDGRNKNGGVSLEGVMSGCSIVVAGVGDL